MKVSDADNIFASTFPCSCGRTHSIAPRQVVYADDAMDRLPAVCADVAAGRRAAVVMDARTSDVAGRAAARMLALGGWDVAEHVVPDTATGGSPVCDELAKSDLAGEIATADLILAVGSGVVCDLCKWIAFERGVPLVVFATAASMNGYTSANVAPTLAGVKSLIRARPPEAVLASPAIICGAPRELTSAGLGDVLAKSVSSADWRMNQLLFNDYYCERSVGLIAEIEPLYLQNPSGVAACDASAVGAVFRALLLTGAAMTMAESSAPASGGEHMISHSLDMMSSIDAVPHDLHGRQVGVATIMMAELYRRVMGVKSPRIHQPRQAIDRRFWGPLAGAVEAAYEQKADRLVIAAEKLARGEQWDRVRNLLGPMLRPPGTIRQCLRDAGAAWRAEDIKCSRERLLAALLHAHEIRPRFTILDMAWLIGVLPSAAGEIVKNWS